MNVCILLLNRRNVRKPSFLLLANVEIALNDFQHLFAFLVGQMI